MMRSIHLLLSCFFLAVLSVLQAQSDSIPCRIASVYYQMGYVADLEMTDLDSELFQKRPPHNSWTYFFTDGRITRMTFDPDRGNTRSAKLYYEYDRLVEILFQGGFTYRKTFSYDESGQLVKAYEHYIAGAADRYYETRKDTLVQTAYNPDSGQVESQEIILNDHYRNLTFPFHHQPYFDELFSIQPYYEEPWLTVETIRDTCGNPVYRITRFANEDGTPGMIQQVKAYTITYR